MNKKTIGALIFVVLLLVLFVLFVPSIFKGVVPEDVYSQMTSEADSLVEPTIIWQEDDYKISKEGD